jgi:hypothetical protein
MHSHTVNYKFEVKFAEQSSQICFVLCEVSNKIVYNKKQAYSGAKRIDPTC